MSSPAGPEAVIARKLPGSFNETIRQAWAAEILTDLHEAGWRVVTFGPCPHPREKRRHLLVKTCDCRSEQVNGEWTP